MIHVLKPGLLTTIQDFGRYGHQKHGVIASGVMDQEAYRIANLLVGNEQHAPVLEVTLMGPVLEFQQDVCLSICGGDLTPMINGERVGTWKPLYIKQGSELRFGKPKTGFRAYLAVAGGFDIPITMNSASTYIRAGIGGHQGRPLEKGDVLEPSPFSPFSKRVMEQLKSDAGDSSFHEASWYVGHDFNHNGYTKDPIRIMPGREYDWFDEESRGRLTSETFNIDSKSDRMGYRLTGCRLSAVEERDLLSEAVTFGTIQVPAEGNPIILLADRQTTGGYPKIAQVASVDLPRLAQMRPGESFSFTMITHEEAQRLYLQQEKDIKLLARGIEMKLK